jgi:hypothetical protein
VEATNPPLSLGQRLLYVVLFALVLWVLGSVLAVAVLVQVVVRLATGHPNAGLARFGGGLARYAAQIIAFLLWTSDRVPFPFSDFPQVPDRITQDDLSSL